MTEVGSFSRGLELPLSIAVREGHIHVMKFLLEMGVSVNYPLDESPKPYLHLVAFMGTMSMKYLEEFIARPTHGAISTIVHFFGLYYLADYVLYATFSKLVPMLLAQQVTLETTRTPRFT